jgi:hypothetical protein
VFYKKTENTEMEVVRILHERMDLKNKLRLKEKRMPNNHLQDCEFCGKFILPFVRIFILNRKHKV